MQMILKHAKKYRLKIILTLLIVIFGVYINLYIPKLNAGIINEGLVKGDSHYLKTKGPIMLIYSILSLLTGLLSLLFAATISYSLSADLRKDVFKKINEFSLANFNKLSNETLLTRLTNDVDKIARLFMMSLVFLIQAPLLIIIAYIMSVNINSELAHLIIAILPVIILIFFIANRFVKPIFKKMQKNIDRINNVVRENVIGIRDVKSYMLEDNESEKFEKQNESLKMISTKAVIIINLLAPIGSIVALGLGVYMLSRGSKLILEGKLTPGDLLAFTSYSTQIINGLMMMFGFFSSLIQANASIDRINEIYNMKSTLKEPKNPIREMKNTDIVFSNVTFGYNEKEIILKDISFSVKEGTSLGIIGQTGSGKSTLVDLISRKYDPQEGKITIGGIDIKDYDIKYLNTVISHIEQQAKLFSGTIKSNILLGNNTLKDKEVSKVLQLAQASNFVDRYTDTISHKVEQNGSNYSGGQKQRISIARAIAKNSKIMIIDDATSALDYDTERKIQKMINENLNQNLTKIIVSQRISSVQNCDNILVLEDGKIIDSGTHEELIKTSKLYTDIYNMQGGDRSE